jgi:hypothetical protein
VEAAGRDDAEDRGGGLGVSVRAVEQPVLATDDDVSQRSFGARVVERDVAVEENAAQTSPEVIGNGASCRPRAAIRPNGALDRFGTARSIVARATAGLFGTDPELVAKMVVIDGLARCPAPAILGLEVGLFDLPRDS